MMIDIELGGATPTAALALRQCQPMAGGAQFGALVVIRSAGFSAVERNDADAVTIHGELHETDEDQRMSFRFTAAIQCLSELERGLREVLDDR